MSREKSWTVGERVQWIDYESTDKSAHGTIYEGTISGVTMETREKRGYYRYDNGRPGETEQFVSHVTVKWDDGEEDTLDHYSVEPVDSTMEREFRTLAPVIANQISEKLALANKYLSEAEAISEEHGIPFGSSISALSQDYFPNSFPTKWDGVSKRVMQDVTQTHNEHDSYYGWVHSSVC